MILSGDLRKIGLPAVLQILLVERVSGTLTILPQGEVRLSSGHIIKASTPLLEGEEALIEILFRGGEKFEVCEEVFTTSTSLIGLNHAVFEAYRVKDEWLKISRNIYQRGCPVAEFPKPLQDFAQNLDGTHPVDELLEESPVKIIDSLLLAIREKKMRYRGRAEKLPKKGFYEWMDLARHRWKKKDFVGAEEAFLRARALRPTDKTVQQNLLKVREMRHAHTE